LLSQCQSGFRGKRNTEPALQVVISEWMGIKDRGKGGIAVFLDYRRAFETVNRDLLSKKLKNTYSITGAIYEWLENYLSSRYQKVKFSDQESSEIRVKNGIPQ
jgi:Reverse transcriptase (RNA-dependent DNA polymerase).